MRRFGAFHGIYAAVTAVLVLMTVSLVLSMVSLIRVSRTARDAKNVAVQIQRERARSTRESCEATNDRHDDTIATIDRVLVTAAYRQFRMHVPEPQRRRLERISQEAQVAGPGRLTALLAEVKGILPAKDDGRIDQSRGQTVLLIDALAPKRDCEALVRQQVGKK